MNNKKERKRYDYNYLKQHCEENKIELLEDYSNKKINQKVRIRAKCLSDGCSNEVEKTFRMFINSDCYCKYHTNKNRTEKYKARFLKKHGVEYSFQLEDVKEKSKATNMKKRGVKNPMQSEDVKEKSKATNMKKRGVEYTFQSEDVKEKSKATNMKKRGVEYIFQSEEFKEKSKATNLKKRGVKHPMQDAEIAQKQLKNSFRKKIYKFPSGRIEEVQGYEPFTLNDLLKEEKILEEDIFVKRTEVPKILWYDENGVEHYYYIDCFIKSQNRCIETKSPWTFKLNREVFLKQKAVKDAGYLCEIWIWDKKGVKVKCYT